MLWVAVSYCAPAGDTKVDHTTNGKAKEADVQMLASTGDAMSP